MTDHHVRPADAPGVHRREHCEHGFALSHPCWATSYAWLARSARLYQSWMAQDTEGLSDRQLHGYCGLMTRTIASRQPAEP